MQADFQNTKIKPSFSLSHQTDKKKNVWLCPEPGTDWYFEKERAFGMPSYDEGG